MQVKIGLVITLLLGAFASAQEIRRIDLIGAQESHFRDLNTETYTICGMGVQSKRSVTVSIESLSQAEIDPRQNLSVVLKVKNDGQYPVVLPIGSDATLFQPDAEAVLYSAELPINAGVSDKPLATLGQLELYGSSLKPDSTVNLMPGEWVTVYGNFKPKSWVPGRSAVVFSDLQLYEQRSATNPSSAQEECVQQGVGRKIAARFKP
jgi:hypothetical protein